MRHHAPSALVFRSALWGVIACGSAEPIAPVDAPLPASAVAPAPAPARFVGSATCLGCHPEAGAAWSGSHHAKAWTAPAPTDPVDPTLTAGPVVGWVGWAPMRQPLVDLGGGRIQAWERAWDPARQEWFALFDDGRRAGDRGHWTGPSMTWNSQCAPCHATEVVVGWDEATGTYTTTTGEQGVGCEACHGPGSAHAADQSPIGVAEPGFDACFGCHARRADLDPTVGVVPVLDRYAPALVDRGATFWPDGQVRDEDFEANAFLGSRMYQQGVACSDCHEPHGGKLRAEGDALCLGCHAGLPAWQAHDQHGGAVACVDCHMPVTTYMARHPRRDHGFPIPDPEFRAPRGIPDPCTKACHQDQTGAWAGEALLAWGLDPSDRPHRDRILAVEATPEAPWPSAVLALVDEDPHPTWRAVGLSLLGPWVSQPEIRDRLYLAAQADDPLLRFAAVGSLEAGDPALQGHLIDPVLAVRVQAQRRSMGQLGPRDPRMRDLARYLAVNLDQPDPALEYANWLVVHRDPRGVEALRRAWTRWPGEPAVAHALAVVLAQRGDAKGAVEALNQATQHRPDDAGLWDALGRARAGADDTEGAIAALREAVRLDPGRGRTWYNLGILLDASGDVDAALAAWARASRAAPTDPDPGWAAATAEERRGRRAEALSHVAAALAIAPDHPELRALARRLEAP